MCVVRLSSTECGSSQGEQCCQKYHSTHQRTYKEVKCMDPKFVCVKKIDQSINLFSEHRSGGWCFIRTNQLPVPLHNIAVRTLFVFFYVGSFLSVMHHVELVGLTIFTRLRYNPQIFFF